MAAVAGGIADCIGRTLLAEGVQQLIIENGGDIFLVRDDIVRVSIFAGQSALSNRVGIELAAGKPLGVCTSSGTVGHSFSMGEADSATVVAESAYLADAAATRLGNEVAGGMSAQENVNNALEIAKTIEEIVGVVVVCEEVLGAVGDIKLVKIE